MPEHLEDSLLANQGRIDVIDSPHGPIDLQRAINSVDSATLGLRNERGELLKPGEARSSEVTVTVPTGDGRFAVVPSLFDGRLVGEDEALKLATERGEIIHISDFFSGTPKTNPNLQADLAPFEGARSASILTPERAGAIRSDLIRREQTNFAGKPTPPNRPDEVDAAPRGIFRTRTIRYPD